jgi:hypothetical protein
VLRQVSDAEQRFARDALDELRSNDLVRDPIADQRPV